jgi:hypothetical protein
MCIEVCTDRCTVYILHKNIIIIIIYLFIYLTANGFIPGGSGTSRIRHNTQDNTPRSNKAQYTKLHSSKDHTIHIIVVN